MARHSTGDYPPDWANIARGVKEAAGWKCVRCGHEHDPAAGYTLTVHHLDMDPSNCRWWNIPALCQRCHLQIQARVVMERPWLFEHSAWFRPYVAGYYAYHLLGEDLSREEVEARMEALLAAGQPWKTLMGVEANRRHRSQLAASPVIAESNGLLR